MAKTTHWTGAVSTDPTNVANWSNGFPANGDDVTIDNANASYSLMGTWPATPLLLNGLTINLDGNDLGNTNLAALSISGDGAGAEVTGCFKQIDTSNAVVINASYGGFNTDPAAGPVPGHWTYHT